MRTPADTSLLQARLESVQALGRVADVMLGIALDVIEPFASDYLSAAEYGRLCRLVQASVDAAVTAALTTIESEIALVAEVDSDINRRLRRAGMGPPKL
jgi:hypothetical protein